ncbi:MAG: Gmad2 immunoglobulin-like domain-containing protein [Hyphomonadaceae bacterium]
MIRAVLLALALAACAEPAQQQSDAAPRAIEVTAPLGGAIVTSPLRVEGVAPNDWYFEAIFDARLLGPSGELLDEAPAQAQTDWTQPGPVPFVAEFDFAVPAPQDGIVVLTAYSGGEDEQSPPRELRIHVELSPG